MSAAFVVDASIAASWFLPDELSEESSLLMSDLNAAPGLAPTLFWFETRNLFVMSERRGRIGPGAALEMTRALRNLPIDDAGPGSDAAIVTLALKYQLSAYDASYLALARSASSALATADRKMAASARSEGIDIVGPLRHAT